MVPIEELRIGIIGSVDSGKSTLTGVLTKDILDDGRGFARSKILHYPHEKESGRTSSVAQHFIRNRIIKEDIKNINYDDDTIKGNDENIIKGKAVEHTIGFIDLAGHEKYLKTTVCGINRCLIDYACVVIGSNMGVLRMTIEHIGIAISMNIPIFIVMTKIDLAPPNIRQKTYKDILSLLNKRGGNRIPILIKNREHLTKLSQYYDKKDYITPVPIFQVSSVHGNGLDILKGYINNLQCYHDYEYLKTKDANFIIETTFIIKGLGMVISGIMQYGIIKMGDILHIGPFGNEYYKVMIKSIHNNFRENIPYLEAGQTGCFNIKVMNRPYFKRENIRKGVRIMQSPKIYTHFSAIIKILHHPTTIKAKYQPTIHCGAISQVASICNITDLDGNPKEYLRLGDKAIVEFKFCFRPEYIQPDTMMIFREGKTKGIGKIIKVY